MSNKKLQIIMISQELELYLDVSMLINPVSVIKIR